MHAEDSRSPNSCQVVNQRAPSHSHSQLEACVCKHACMWSSRGGSATMGRAALRSATHTVTVTVAACLLVRAQMAPARGAKGMACVSRVHCTG